MSVRLTGICFFLGKNTKTLFLGLSRLCNLTAFTHSPLVQWVNPLLPVLRDSPGFIPRGVLMCNRDLLVSIISLQDFNYPYIQGSSPTWRGGSYVLMKKRITPADSILLHGTVKGKISAATTMPSENSFKKSRNLSGPRSEDKRV
jgi:hypothetical protein